jgi:hypothetical protein
VSIRLRPGLLLAAAVLAVLQTAGLGHTAEAGAAAGSPRLLGTDPNRLVFELSVPLPEIQPVSAQGQDYHRLRIPGYGTYGQPGQPELPGTGVLVGIPPEGDVTIRVLEQQVEDLPGTYTVYPVPTWGPVDGAGSTLPDPLHGLRPQVAPDAAAYAQDAFWPAALVAVDEIGWVRQQRVARLAVHPVQVNPARSLVRVARLLRVEVTFSPPPALAEARAAASSDAFDPLLQAQLLNYDQSRAWRLPRQRPAQLQAWEQEMRPGDTSRTWLKLVVREAGIYGVTADDLRNAGLPAMADANPALLQIWRNGHQVPADLLGDLDGRFAPGEALVFYAHVQPSIFSRDTVYWLAVGDQPGLRMPSRNSAPWGLVPQTASPATVRLEQDLIFRTDLPYGGTPTDPRWYWDKISSIGIGSKSFQVTLPAALASGYDATLRARFVGITSLAAVAPDHHLRWEINGRVIGDMTWDGAEPFVGTLSFPAAWLTSGDNQLRVVLPKERPEITLDESYLDWVEIGYQRSTQQAQDVLAFELEGTGRRDVSIQTFSGSDVLLYDVTSGDAPRRMLGSQVVEATTSAARAADTGVGATLAHRMHLPLVTLGLRSGTFAVRFGVELNGPRQFVATRSQSLRPVDQFIVDRGSSWRSPDHQADYLLITHGSLEPAAQALAGHRQSRGLSVALVDAQDIYDEFGNGEMSPTALHDFVAYAYQNWRAPLPAYVLLMGDGHYDFRMATGMSSVPVLIPPYYGCFDPWLCEVASDNHYVAVSGNDRLPDLAIGRITATNLDDATLIVAKIVDYERQPPAGAWRTSLAFVADNYRNAAGDPDGAGDFESYSESVISQLPPAYSARRIYYDPYPADDAGQSFRYRASPAATTAILDSVNQGLLFVNYIGHAAVNLWASEWLLVGKGRDRNDVAQMANGPRLPIFVDMTCLSGNFADPGREALQETLLAHPGGGSIAGWAATGLGVANGHDALHRGFYQALFGGGVTRLGLATVAAKQYLWAQTGAAHADLLDTFGLVGDPALDIPSSTVLLSQVDR